MTPERVVWLVWLIVVFTLAVQWGGYTTLAGAVVGAFAYRADLAVRRWDRRNR